MSGELDVFRDIPGYKAILKSVLKSQIQLLLEQLSKHTGEESIILTASINDGALSHLGSNTGKGFLEGREELKSQFLGFCLKSHHKKQSGENRPTPYQRPEVVKTPPKRMGPASRVQQKGPRTVQPPVAVPTLAAQEGQTSATGLSDQAPALEDMSAISMSANTGIVLNQMTAEKNSAIVKVEQAENSDSNSESQDFTTTSANFPPSLDLSHTQTSASQESVGLSRNDSSNEIAGDDDNDTGFDNEDSSGATSIKIEPINENDMELEITGIEPGSTTLTPENWSQGQMNYGTPGNSGDESQPVNQTTDASGYSLTWPRIHTWKIDEQSNATKHASSSMITTRTSADGDQRPLTVKMESSRQTDSNQSNNIRDDIKLPSGEMKPSCNNDVDDDDDDNDDNDDETVSEDKKGKWNSISRCEICNKSYSTIYNLKRHLKVHREVHVCSFCNKKFESYITYIKHLKIHQVSPILCCSLCGRTFTSRTGLAYHTKMHEGTFKFHCETCGKGFNHKAIFEGHQAKHAGVKLYKCEKCNKPFMYKSNLSYHVKHCGQKIKNSITCVLCGVTFKHQRYLMAHMQVHKNPRQYQCSSCGVHFKHRASLHKHLKRCGQK